MIIVRQSRGDLRFQKGAPPPLLKSGAEPIEVHILYVAGPWCSGGPKKLKQIQQKKAVAQNNNFLFLDENQENVFWHLTRPIIALTNFLHVSILLRSRLLPII